MSEGNPADWPSDSGLITKVEGWDAGGERVAVTWNDGWTYAGRSQADYEAAGVRPEPGMDITLYGGLGHTVKGMDIAGRRVFYLSQEEAEAEHAAMVQQMHADRQQRWEAADRERLLREAADLPAPLPSRVLRLLAAHADFGPEHLAYELAGLKAAAAIWRYAEQSTFGPYVFIDQFVEMGWAEQIALIPEAAEADSGNLFGWACLMARILIESPKDALDFHAAIAPLTGCAEVCSHPLEET